MNESLHDEEVENTTNEQPTIVTHDGHEVSHNGEDEACMTTFMNIESR